MFDNRPKFPSGEDWPVGSSKVKPVTAPSGSSLLPALRRSCLHDGTKPIVQLTGLTLFGAQGGSLTNARHLDLVVDCAGLVQDRRQFVRSRLQKFARLNDLIWPEVVRLDWPDMTAPHHVGIAFWIKLRSLLVGNVAFACVGAHGRTGTAIAAILIADGRTAAAAIETVRTKYCDRAIETRDQETYLVRLAADYKQTHAVR